MYPRRALDPIRLVGPADEPIRRVLLGELLPHRNVDARLDWIYRKNPHGRALSWIAWDEATGEAAGLTTFFPRRVWVDGRTIPGALGGDMYVRPRFRRRGYGRRLFVAARRDMERLGVHLMFGTPMRPNVTSLVTSGSTVAESAVVRYARIVGATTPKLAWLPRPIVDRLQPLLRPRQTGRLRLDPVTGADPRVERLWAETRDELSIATVRDAEFYRWRFVEAPAQRQRPYVVLDRGQPIAACALESMGNKLRIVDLFGPQRHWRAALSAIAAEAGPVAMMELRLGAGDAAHRRLWTSFMVAREGEPMSMLTPEGRPVADLHDPARWFITWADTDIDHF